MGNVSTSKTISTSVWAQKGATWRAVDVSARPYSVINTGFVELDQLIQLGGWPLGTTTEIGLAEHGIGELRLLMPGLRNALNGTRPYMIWVAPPYLPYSQALIKEHIDPARLIIVKAKSPVEVLWVAEQVLLANSCGVLLTWSGSYPLNHKETRRLQLAAAKSDTWHVQFRHQHCLQHTSAARMRLRITNHAQGRLSMVIDKQPQGMGGQQCTVSLPPYYEQWQRLAATQLPQHNRPLVKSLINRKLTFDTKANGARRTVTIDEG